MTTNTMASKLSIVQTSSDPIRLDRGETVHVGVDVHKRTYHTYHIALVSNQRSVIATWVQPASPEVPLE